MRRYSMLIYIPGDKELILNAVGALRLNVLNFPFPIVVHGIVDNESAALLLDRSGLFSKVSIVKDEDEINNLLLNDNYSVCINLNPTKEEGLFYAEEEAEKKKEELKKYIDTTEDIKGPTTGYSYLMTAAKIIEAFLKNLDESWNMTTYVNIIDVKPYFGVKKLDKDSVFRKLRVDLDLSNRDFILVSIPNNATEQEKRMYNAIGRNTELDYLLVDESGTVVTDPEVSFSPIEMCALIARDNCMGVVGTGWAPHIASITDKPFFIHVTDEENIWNGIRDSRCTTWALATKKLNDLVIEVSKISNFYLQGVYNYA